MEFNITYEDEKKKEHKKSPFLSAVLTLILPGLGQIYCGHIGRGILIFVFIILLFIPYNIMKTFGQMNVGYTLMILVLDIAFIYDAYKLAEKKNL